MVCVCETQQYQNPHFSLLSQPALDESEPSPRRWAQTGKRRTISSLAQAPFPSWRLAPASGGGASRIPKTKPVRLKALLSHQTPILSRKRPVKSTGHRTIQGVEKSSTKRRGIATSCSTPERKNCPCLRWVTGGAGARGTAAIV